MTVPIFDALALGVDSLKEAAGLTVAELRDRGLTLADAKFVQPLAAVYWRAKPKGIAEACKAARAAGHSLRVLARIEVLAARCEDPNAARVTLCGTAEAKLDEVGARLATPKTRVESARHTYGKDGWHRLVINTQDPWLMDMLGALPGDNLLDGFKQFVAGGEQIQAPARAAHVVIRLDEHEEYVAEGKLIRATDGTVRPARLLAQEKLAEVGYVTLVTDWGEPVDCFKSTPIFNEKQTLMAFALHPQCIHPGCVTPALLCERDHFIPRNKGGDTNVANLVPLCRFHNGRKADGDSYTRDAEGNYWYVTPYGKRLLCTVD
ncbi:HNH endonuclease signature motif containing protein [Corynebacterium phoceense]|uniref:HNH endonuclease signature motif containing protein n=1 Tax=Corynebacterium phoceense TaxID=1686286 RepID=UPI0034CD458E